MLEVVFGIAVALFIMCIAVLMTFGTFLVLRIWWKFFQEM